MILLHSAAIQWKNLSVWHTLYIYFPQTELTGSSFQNIYLHIFHEFWGPTF